MPQVRVVDEEGNQLGVMPTPQALRLAQERGYDLVEVAPMAGPPVTRLLDYGQFKYEQARSEKEARRHQRSVEFKEIRLKVKIGKGDFDTKVRRAIQFLEDGDRVKVTVQFRGREVSHAYLGRDLLTRFAEQVARARQRRAPAAAGRQARCRWSSPRRTNRRSRLRRRRTNGPRSRRRRGRRATASRSGAGRRAERRWPVADGTAARRRPGG